MSKNILDRIDYLVALVAEFAKMHHLSTQKAYEYLRKHKGMDFALDFYDVNHTLSFDNMVEDITYYCHRMGGELL